MSRIVLACLLLISVGGCAVSKNKPLPMVHDDDPVWNLNSNPVHTDDNDAFPPAGDGIVAPTFGRALLGHTL